MPLLAAATSADLYYLDFSSTNGLTLVGSAAQAGNLVRLTPATADQAGALWVQTKQGVGAGFDTTFEFQLSTAAGADGFAFLIQNSAAAPIGGSGCELGYHGVANSLAIEFDTYSNATCAGGTSGDPSSAHISVHTLGTIPNSVLESASIAATTAVPAFYDGAVHTARVSYLSGVLAVFVDDLTVPVLSASVDISSLLALEFGRAWVGFTASTGGLAEVHDLLSWSFVESTSGSSNHSPAAPTITEPVTNGLTLNPADVHMETGPFSDVDATDQHFCTDWEIWTVSPYQRVWVTACITGVERIHTHVGDGTFENSHAGRSELLPSTSFQLRVRHSDSSGDPLTRWSPWSVRTFVTGSATQVFPLAMHDVVPSPTPRWTVASSGSAVILSPAATAPRLQLESAAGALLLSILANDGVTNTVTNPGPLPGHVPVRVQLRGGSLGLTLPATDLAVVDDSCATERILLPAVTIAPGATNYYWVSTAGATYVGTALQTVPSFTTLARGLTPPWNPRQDGYHVDVFASGFQLPVNIVFVPNAGPGPNDPFLYVTELYGRIKMVTRNGTTSNYASGLLNFSPTGAFPGSGEQGLTGVAVDPATGDVYASLLYASAVMPSVHYPKIVRFTSSDGGRTASGQLTILDMVNEPQGQSHQISNLTLAPDGRLLCHVGDGFTAATALDLESYRGKILRLNLNGTPATDNPFYDASNGITARDYVYAYGVRNPFGGDWRALDGHQYMVENGPSVDRFARIVAGRNYLWNGTDASMTNFALYNWSPARGPVNLAFIQPQTFGGSGFPASSMGHAFVTESGPTYATGTQVLGKRITEWVLDANGVLVAGPIPFLEYAGVGKATACGLEAGPDGLYMTELYYDQGTGATQSGARLLRIRYDPAADCNGNGLDDTCDIASGTSLDVNANGVPDECDCPNVNFCSATANSTGLPARISASGSCFVADNALVLTSTPVPNSVGVFFYGANRENGGAGTPFANGLRCVGNGTVHRLPLVTHASNVATLSLDLTALPVSRPILIGSTWHFQHWFRDFAAGGASSNLSDGLTVTFQ